MAAGDAVVGALRVVLGTDPAQFEDGLKTASDGLKSFAKDAAGVAGGIELAHLFEKAVESMTEFIKKGVEAADQMGKMSQRIGVPVASLGSLSAAAALSDISIEGLGQSMSRLARNMAAVAAGGVGPAASAFHYLGITAKELKTLSPEQVIDKMAASFSKLADGADKTAVAIAIFGRAGAQMIPLLNLGVKGMDELKQMSADLGLVISEKTAKAGEKFVDSTKLMGLAVQGVSNIVAAYFLPSMADAAEGFVKWIAHSHVVQQTAEVIIRTIMFFSDNLYILGAALALVFGGAIITGIVSMTTAMFGLVKTIVMAAVGTLVLAAEWLIIVGVVAAVIAGIGLLVAALIYYTDVVDRVSAAWELLQKAVGAAIDWISNKIETIINAIKKVLEWINQFGGGWDWVKTKAESALTYITDKTGEMNAEIDKTAPKKEEVAGFWDWLKGKGGEALTVLNAGLNAAGINTRAWTNDIAGLQKKLEEMQHALDELLKKKFDPAEAEKTKALDNAVGSLTIKARELGGTYTGVVTPGFLQAAVGAKIFQTSLEAANFDLTKMTPAMLRLDDAMAKTYVAQVQFDNLTPFDKWILKSKELEAAFGHVQDKQDLLAVATFKNTAAMANAYAQMAAEFVGGFAQLFQALGAKNKQMFEIGKNLAIAQALISTFAGATKALMIYGPTPLGYAMMAGAIAAGLAQVVKISQTQYTGAAKGGAFQVPGGSMGVDTKMIGMALAPGEMVNVTPADRARSGGGQVQEIQMTGIKPKDLFTGEMVRGMFDALNRGYSDGYKVKFAT